MDIREVDFNNDPEVSVLLDKVTDWGRIEFEEKPESFHFGVYLDGKLKAVASYLKEEVSHDVHLLADEDFRSKRLFRFLKQATDKAFDRTAFLTVDIRELKQFECSRKIARWFGFVPLPTQESILFMDRTRWGNTNFSLK